ncbi:hypothetical protein LTR85_008094 [Meristemomyces frigidus]|nr:hypothetical protein LTR85_008094 [Meristemomyces frigidus]
MYDLQGDQPPPPSYEEAVRTDPALRQQQSVRIYFCPCASLGALPYEDCLTSTSEDDVLIMYSTTSYLDLQRTAKERYLELFQPYVENPLNRRVYLCTRSDFGLPRRSSITNSTWASFRSTIIATAGTSETSRETMYLTMEVTQGSGTTMYRRRYSGGSFGFEQRMPLDGVRPGYPSRGDDEAEGHFNELETRFSSVLDSARALKYADPSTRNTVLGDLIREAATILAEVSSDNVDATPF